MDCTKLRHRLGLTQEEMAIALDLSRAMVALIETGRNRPSIKTAWKYIDLAHANGMRMRLEDVYPRD